MISCSCRYWPLVSFICVGENEAGFTIQSVPVSDWAVVFWEIRAQMESHMTRSEWRTRKFIAPWKELNDVMGWMAVNSVRQDILKTGPNKNKQVEVSGLDIPL